METFAMEFIAFIVVSVRISATYLWLVIPTSIAPFPHIFSAFVAFLLYLYRERGTVEYVLPLSLQQDLGYYGASVAIQVVFYNQPA